MDDESAGGGFQELRRAVTSIVEWCTGHISAETMRFQREDGAASFDAERVWRLKVIRERAVRDLEDLATDNGIVTERAVRFYEALDRELRRPRLWPAQESDHPRAVTDSSCAEQAHDLATKWVMLFATMCHGMLHDGVIADPQSPTYDKKRLEDLRTLAQEAGRVGESLVFYEWAQADAVKKFYAALEIELANTHSVSLREVIGADGHDEDGMPGPQPVEQATAAVMRAATDSVFAVVTWCSEQIELARSCGAEGKPVDEEHVESLILIHEDAMAARARLLDADDREALRIGAHYWKMLNDLRGDQALAHAEDPLADHIPDGLLAGLGGPAPDWAVDAVDAVVAWCSEQIHLARYGACGRPERAVAEPARPQRLLDLLVIRKEAVAARDRVRGDADPQEQERIGQHYLALYRVLMREDA